MSESKSRLPAPTPTEASIDPVRNFTIAFEERMRAAVIGPPSYAVRKRRIEDAVVEYEDALLEVLVALTRAKADDTRIDDELRAVAASFDLAKTNALITTHNRYYAIEANLPMDPKTGAYLLFGKPWHKEALVTIDLLVERVRARFAEERSAAR